MQKRAMHRMARFLFRRIEKIQQRGEAKTPRAEARDVSV